MELLFYYLRSLHRDETFIGQNRPFIFYKLRRGWEAARFQNKIELQASLPALKEEL
jgi:hypothetical protein